ncbi:MAG: hypothetical protein ACO32R_05485, partial [Ilumatobacteraceae bacterium]
SGDADTDHTDVRPDNNVTPTMPKRNGQIKVKKVSSNQLMAQIDQATSGDELNAIIDLAKELPDDEKNMVRDAYRIKRDELTTTTH